MDPAAFHLILQLVRNGTLGQDDLDQIAAGLEAEGETDAAHAVRAAPFEAFPPDEAEWRRSKLKVVSSGPDGGNRGD